MSMACSIEARVPLLDKTVAELAFQMPASLKYTDRESKILLKRIAARHVPRECVYRPKEGFSIPIKSWLKSEFKGLLETYLNPRASRPAACRGARVSRLMQEHQSNRANHSHILWGLLVFEHWRERWQVTA